MGIINQGILGGFSGKVGPIVGFRWKSNYYIRARAAKVSNPRTPKQQEQRGKFATAFSFLKAIKPFIRIGYKEFTQDKSAFNAAMSYTLKRAVTGSGKEIRIDFDRALVSMGTLMPIFEGTATQNGNKMYFNWQDNSGMGNAEDTDIAMLLVYNKDKETAVYDTKTALRSSQHAELQLPSDWQDDELIAYLSFCSADGNTIANSIRLSVSVIDTPENEIEILTEPIPKNYKTKFIIRSPQGHSDMEVQATTIDRYFTPGSAALNSLHTKSQYPVNKKLTPCRQGINFLLIVFTVYKTPASVSLFCIFLLLLL
uniref:DUF6266 family protein n=1 Tax=Bacteroides cellulosilyticus TaxID=246787 RepID=UPI004024C063